MFSIIRNGFKVKEIRKKYLFTFLMLLVYRLGNIIPVPFIKHDVIKEIMTNTESGIIGLLNLLSGGSLSKMSVFALSIYPYITASIIIQLLTIAIPRLGEIAKEGEQGQKKIGFYTKIGAVILGIFEGYALVQGMLFRAIDAKGSLEMSIILITILAGSMFLIWLGDLITERGIGNGISILIFLGIVSGLPEQFGSWIFNVKAGYMHPLKLAGLIIAVLIMVYIVVLINEGERKVPVQYAKRVVGRKMYGGQSTHIPVKVNMAGVMPVIFSSSVLTLPNHLALLFGYADVPNWYKQLFTVEGNIGVWMYSIINLLLVILFAYFYTAIQFNTVEYAKNLQQYGGFIPGIRPGKPTGEYLQKISNKITFIGALSLALIASAPIALSKVTGQRLNFGGTSIIIVVGVVIETVKQIEALLTMRHYKGFLNK